MAQPLRAASEPPAAVRDFVGFSALVQPCNQLLIMAYILDTERAGRQEQSPRV